MAALIQTLFPSRRIYGGKAYGIEREWSAEVIQAYQDFERARRDAIVRKVGGTCSGCFLNTISNPLAGTVVKVKPMQSLPFSFLAVDASRPDINAKAAWAIRFAKLLREARKCTGPIKKAGLRVDLSNIPEAIAPPGQQTLDPQGKPEICGTERIANPELFYTSDEVQADTPAATDTHDYSMQIAPAQKLPPV